MGDLGIIRRPPRGWLEARAVALDHGVATGGNTTTDGGVIDTSYRLRVRWEVRVPGQAPYVVDDERKAPTWTSETFLGGSGKRFLSVRLKRTFGLLDGVEIPVRVDPADPTALWVDWDGAYDAHVPAWERKGALDRAVAERHGGIDGVLHRIANPFAGRLDAEDRPLLERRLADEQAAHDGQWTAAQVSAASSAWAGVEPDQKAAYDGIAEEMKRLHLVGRESPARVTGVVDTGRRVAGMTVRRYEVEVSDPTPRPAVVELPLPDRTAKKIKPGRQLSVKVDPGDPEKVALVLG